MGIISTFVGTVISDNQHNNNPLCLWGHTQFTEHLPILYDAMSSVSPDFVNDPSGKATQRDACTQFSPVDREINIQRGATLGWISETWLVSLSTRF